MRYRQELEEKLERARQWLLRKLDEEVDGDRRQTIREFLHDINYHPQEFSMDDFMAFAGAGA